jgi:hypothetical protein
MLRAVGLLESHRDADAIDALERAASRRVWNEYLGDEIAGQALLQQETFGSPGVLARGGFAAAILLPHYSALRTAMQFAVERAIESEKYGDVDEGLRIRAAVRGCGSLMRSESNCLIGNLVGIAIVQISLASPDGAPMLKHTANRTSIENQGALVQQFDDYLAKIKRNEQSEAIHLEAEACTKTRQITAAGLSQTVYETDILSLIQLTLVDHILLSCILWMAAIAGVSVMLLAVAKSKAAKRIPAPGGKIAMLFFTLAVASAACAAMLWQASGSIEPFSQAGKMWFSQDGAFTGHKAMVILCDGYLGIIATLPVLTLMLYSVLCLVWRVPISVGLPRALRGSIVPICSCLLLGYAVVAVCTARVENRAGSELDRTVRHEGRHMAEIVGAEWPGAQRVEDRR